MNVSATRKQLQGPRPTPLMVNKSSSKIKKSKQVKSPVIIYLKSPDIIHVRPEEFMGLVQRLTGKQERGNNNLTGSSNSCSSSSTTSVIMADGVGDINGKMKKKNSGFGLSLTEQEFDSPLGHLAQCCLSIYSHENWSEF